MPSDWVAKRNRAKYLSGMEWALIIDALIEQANGNRFHPAHLLASELDSRELAAN